MRKGVSKEGVGFVVGQCKGLCFSQKKSLFALQSDHVGQISEGGQQAHTVMRIRGA